ncbi:MAG TPA: heavy metal sensor histidine kinase [Blastocatellia bacterium]|nr:heavy metal sensor histidine kinase [Blastocatellia bacterium]HMV87563.1 heavy metal sensor histidine kinase [Blastocatellia bacterium]HMX27128.1 heavy metal sensor histidine kinase [Blastocatellia bacterium]HMZ19184.1 heavy metal sensor histidine kinase [Blastocatellia bacterium]HNG32562.1 heavy metal sensor histidine kinase [Blastocatellia bacterium]
MLSLRVKLTGYYLAILSAVLLLFGVAIYFYLSHSLLTTIDESLAFQVEKIEFIMAIGAGVEPPNRPQGESGQEELLQLSPHVIQIINEQGRITDENLASPKDRLSVNVASLMKLKVGETVFDSIKLGSGEPMRVATRRVKDHDGDGTYFIRLGHSLEALQSARRRALLVLILAIPVALLLGSFGGLLLANQALSPVDRITSAAELIAKGDLTERVPAPEKMDEIGRLAATFNHMISRLQAAFERQKQFTSDASHELRTPLAVMRGDIEITLRRDRPTDEYKRVLESNLEEIVRLSRLVEDLLMLARGDSGQLELRREPVDLNKLCRQMTDYISPLAMQREQTLTYAAADAETFVNADLQRIKQLLLNLLDNAIKYTEPGGRITLGLKAEENCAVITVADTGRGIPAEDLPHIFERFFRRSAKTSDRSASGFGLGLSIVKWIVDSHDGKIETKSQPGHGTEFIVKLPLLG